jgi:tetratricopeptide (TPR) repeat protein
MAAVNRLFLAVRQPPKQPTACDFDAFGLCPRNITSLRSGGGEIVLEWLMNLAQEWILIVGLFYLYHLIRWQMRRGDYALARLHKLVRSRSLREVERLASTLIQHPHCPPRSRAAALRCRAWSRICSGRLKEARDDAAQALEWNPRDGRAYLVKAMADWQAHPETALHSLDLAEQYRELRGRREFDRAVRKFRGLALSRLGRGPEAVAQLQGAILPEDRVTQRYLGHALALCGRYQEALQRLEAAGDKNPRFAMGVFLLTSGRAQESLFWLNRARDERPASVTLFFEAGALYQLGDERGGDRCMEEWMSILQRPADFNLYPELTEFGRTHLAGRNSAGSLRN